MRLADVHGLLETRQVLLGEIERGMRQKRTTNELLRDIKDKRALVVGHIERVTAVSSSAAASRCWRFFPRSNG